METEFSLTQIEKHLRHYSELDVSRVLEECQEWSSATSLVVRTPTRLIENIFIFSIQVVFVFGVQTYPG